MQTDSFRRTNDVLRHIGSEASLVRGSESTFPHPKHRFPEECRTSTTFSPFPRNHMRNGEKYATMVQNNRLEDAHEI